MQGVVTLSLLALIPLLHKDITSGSKSQIALAILVARAMRKKRDKMAVVTERGNKIRQDYAEWLQGYNWDYFLTSTFRKPRRDPYYALQGVWRVLKQHFVARAFLVAEPFQSGDLHIHGLAAGRGPSWYPELQLPWDIWAGLFKRFGRAKVEACNSQEAVTGYCAKYLLKQQSSMSDFYEIFGSKNAWQDGRDLTNHLTKAFRCDTLKGNNEELR